MLFATVICFIGLVGSLFLARRVRVEKDQMERQGNWVKLLGYTAITVGAASLVAQLPLPVIGYMLIMGFGSFTAWVILTCVRQNTLDRLKAIPLD
jgi:fructose-specific phosphotransferase system IIC component